MKIKDILYIIGYILIGVLTRTVFHIAPNVEFVTGVTLASAYFIKKGYSISVPFVIMFLSDFIIGNSSIFLFTWSAFAFAWIGGKFLRSKLIEKISSKTQLINIFVLSELGGLAFTIFFFLWTNFGVVVVSNMYPKNFQGLLLSYKMGLPFLAPQLLGNLIIVPSIFLISHILYSFSWKKMRNINLKLK